MALIQNLDPIILKMSENSLMIGISNTLAAEVNNAIMISCDGGGPLLEFLCERIIKSAKHYLEKLEKDNNLLQMACKMKNEEFVPLTINILQTTGPGFLT